MSTVAKVQFVDYPSSIGKALDLLAAPAQLPQEGLIIIKPNLTNTAPPPVTTSIAAAQAVYAYCKCHTKAKIAIGEGTGSGRTIDAFARLGYADFAQRHGVELIDFNEAETVLLKDRQALQLKHFHMPEIVRDAFVISVPVLKDHALTGTTIAMKNMFGIAPGKVYAGSWNKSKLHSPSTARSVVDVCRYKKPDLSVVDASIALAGGHISGSQKNVGFILAGFDPVAVDAVGSELLGHDPKRIQYLKLANGLLGSMDDIEVINS
jgi:uncharacterized protein (DUF362 family)